MVVGPWLLWFIPCVVLVIAAIELDLSEEEYIRNAILKDVVTVLLLAAAVICACVALVQRSTIYPTS